MAVIVKDMFGTDKPFETGFIIFYHSKAEDKMVWNFITKLRGRKGVSKFIRNLRKNGIDYKSVVSCKTGIEIPKENVKKWLSVGKPPEKLVLMLDD